MILDPITAMADSSRAAADPQDPALRLRRLDKASVEFEAMLIEQVFKSMEGTLENGGLVGSGVSGSVYSSILTETVARSMAEHQSLGLAEQLRKDTIRRDPELKSLEEAKTHALGQGLHLEYKVNTDISNREH